MYYIYYQQLRGPITIDAATSVRRVRVKEIAILVTLLAVIPLPAAGRKKVQDEGPTATLNFVILKDDNGKPVRNAAVVMHPVNKKGKQERGGLELKTDAEGKCGLDGIPYGKLRVQVLAPGFQTFGDDYDVNQSTMGITIKLKLPGGQYSIYEEHSGEKKEEAKKP